MSSLAERLQLVVDATTGQAEAKFAKLGDAAETTGKKATSSGQAVAAAADRVANARLKEADAADAVRIAELRLSELHEKGSASASQLATAEARVESARRKQHNATRDLTAATDAQIRANAEAQVSSEDAAQGADRMGDGIKGLAGKVAGLVGGLSLADWARDAVLGFADGARSAQAMATSMNATVEEAGAFLGLVGSVGLELDDLIEIQAEFAGKTRDGLTQIGTELKHNSDGTVNWTGTLVDTLAELQKMPDATERNRLGFSMFGEEGYKQLSRLLNSGVDVREALERIGTPFTEEDVAAAREFDDAMLGLSSTSGELGRTIGRAVLPVLTGLVNAGQTVADVIGGIPAPLGLAAAISLGLGYAMRAAGTEGSFLAGRIAAVTATLGAYRTSAATTIASNGLLGASFGVARGAASGLTALAGGPFGVALLAAGAAYYFASEGADDFRESARKVAVELTDADDNLTKNAETIERHARAMVEDAGAWENATASVKGYNKAADESGIPQWLQNILGGTTQGIAALAGLFGETELATIGAAEGIKEAADELGAYEQEQQTAQVATRTLNDLIAEGTVEGEAFAEAVRDTAEAQAEETRTTDLAKAAIDAYNATTRDAVQTTLDLYSAQLGQRDGLIGVQQAFYELADTVDDAETPWNEITEATNRAIESTLSYAETAADAAVSAARAAGTVLDPLTEAQIRADATIAALRESLNDPNMTADARAQIEGLIGQLDLAKTNSDITALLTLTGTEEAQGELDATTGDREARINVESRGGPAVDAYLDSLAQATRLTLIRVESRNGPAVADYLRALADAQRLALIRAESRNGPAVAAYLDGIASQYRLAIINVETRGGPAVDAYLDSLAGRRTAIIDAQRGAGLPSTGSGAPTLPGAPTAAAIAGAMGASLRSLELDLKLTGTLDRAQVSRAERGRAIVEDVRAYEQRNGTGWRRLP